MNTIVEKICVRLTFRLVSPLALSSGENMNSDKDAIRDSLGRPYIPASSIAGVCTNLIRHRYNEKDFKKYYGYVTINDGKGSQKSGAAEKAESAASRVLFYNAEISEEKPEEKYRITLRDGVGLNERKIAIKGAKFDMEVVEPCREGLLFTTFLTQDLYKGDTDQTDQIIRLFAAGQLTFGGKTMRGYGLTELTEFRKRTFSMAKKEDVLAWVGFDMFEEKAVWDVCASADSLSAAKNSLYPSLHLELHPKGAVMIRKYTTRPSKDKDHPEPDYEQLMIRGNIPVIPGTSWTGAFRHRMKEMGLNEEEIANLFGFIKGRTGHRSKIRFSETKLVGAKEKRLSRNAIDRFTGGTASGALYTERTFYGGNGGLDISFTRDLDDKEVSVLAAAITDLHYGFLAVGGLTAVGKGLFTVDKVNDFDLSDEDSPEEIYDLIKELIQETQTKEEAES